MVCEPAKWVAALRHSDPEWSPRCLFRFETGAGAHTGPSGRFAHLAYEAERSGCLPVPPPRRTQDGAERSLPVATSRSSRTARAGVQAPATDVAARAGTMAI